jgi:Uma2 family endonuclease
MPELVYDRQRIESPYLLRLYGFDEEGFFRFAPESSYCELLDGVLIVPSPAAIRHQKLTVFLTDLLHGWCLREDKGTVLTGPAVMRLTASRLFEPDVMVVRSEHSDRIVEQFVNGPADLVVEILSESTRDYDLNEKARAYRDGDVPEAWFVDEKQKRIVVDRAGQERQEAASGRLESNSLPGFWIDAGWLWQPQLPNPRRLLEGILNG